MLELLIAHHSDIDGCKLTILSAETGVKPVSKMGAVAVAEGNGTKFTEQEMIAEYRKLIKLRDDVFANKHPVLKLSKRPANLGKSSSATGQSISAVSSSPPVPNGIHKPSFTADSQPTQHFSTHTPNHLSNPVLPNSVLPNPSNARKIPTPASAPSGIDPIFLTKSDVLVRAEIQQKRQRIERMLEEQQLHQKRLITSKKTSDQEISLSFDVTEILRKAQELVKPVKIHQNTRANEGPSSSDSFDENTYYSSQMNESTTTEEVDESGKWRPHRICRFFLKGETCRYGDNCTFSHDPALKQKLEADGSQAMDLDSVNADEQISSRPTDPPKHVLRSEMLPQPPAKEVSTESQRVAELEEQLRIAKSQLQGYSEAQASSHAKETHESQEEPAYSPPGPDEFGRDVGLREHEVRKSVFHPTQRPTTNLQATGRERPKRNEHLPSPSTNDVRVVRNHITSPIAPQPARVSPLAVAKVPQIAQIQRNHGESRRPSRASNADEMTSGQSPKASSQPVSSRKRRRGPDSGEQVRNVIPRRDVSSPEVRVKEEPTSPPLFNDSSEIRRLRQRQEPSRTLYVDTGAPQYRDFEPVLYHPRPLDLPPQAIAPDDRRPLTPLARRVITRNGQHYFANEEPDLRRVVSARQVRAPASPAPYSAQYSAPQARATRAVSQVYISPTGRGAPIHYRSSVQPQSATFVAHDRSPSPPRRTQQSPVEPAPIAMAPPPRRIMVDQWGQRFMEAPISAERQASAAPILRRSEIDPHYEPVVAHGRSVRQPQFVSVNEESRYVQRVPSPMSPGLYEYPPPERVRHPVHRRSGYYDADPYATRVEGTKVAPHSETRSASHYDKAVGPREGVVRMQSVRPTERNYELPREHIPRVQSVRPQQPRIVNLGERQEARGQGSRQVSVLGDDGAIHQVSYAMDDRPRYQYNNPVQERGGFVEEMQNVGGMYEVPGESLNRRAVQ